VKVPWPEDVNELSVDLYRETMGNIPLERIKAGVNSMIAAITAVDPTWTIDDLLNKLFN
jgi:hypothetical protein